MIFYTLLLFLTSTLLLNRNKHIGEEFCVFCKFAFLSIRLLTPSPPLLLLLPVSTYKLSISTDMIMTIEIQITKLLATFLTESHCR